MDRASKQIGKRDENTIMVQQMRQHMCILELSENWANQPRYGAVTHVLAVSDTTEFFEI